MEKQEKLSELLDKFEALVIKSITKKAVSNILGQAHNTELLYPTYTGMLKTFEKIVSAEIKEDTDDLGDQPFPAKK